MPTLHWIGKEKVVNHHQDVPFRVLEHKYGFTADSGNQDAQTNSGNKIIHGDNLEALKALLPEYEGRIRCIYIDPPYNTGNESWKYNDNVNDSKIKKWLGEVVGKEGEDLSRHDKWLSMMYPRLRLLHKLLSEDGLIFISIDDHEYQNLKIICDEIFGRKNFVTNFTWRTEGNFDNQAKIKINHEYILCFSKNSDLFDFPELIDPNIGEDSKLFNSEIRNTIVKNGPKNPISEITLPVGFPVDFKDGIIKARTDSWPHYLQDAIVENNKLTTSVVVRSGWSSKKIFTNFIENKFQAIKDTKGQNTTFTITRTGAIENIKKRDKISHVISSLYNMGSTQNMSSELSRMGISFDYPKPVQLIQYLIDIVGGKDYLVLDCFAGSGTTGHAVINLNKKDKGTRKFILIEMQNYSETVIAERVRRVVNGYADIAGTGGSFDYYELGQPIFKKDKNLNEEVGENKIREYIYYTETRQYLKRNQEEGSKYLLDTYNDTGYYFYYEKDKLTTLGLDTLSIVSERADQYIIYADKCLLDKEYMLAKNIVFKKIPRDIKRF